MNKNNEIFYLSLDNNNMNGFYNTNFHDEEFCKSILDSGGIIIDEELHSYLVSLCDFKFIGLREERLYTIKDKDLFIATPPRIDTTPQQPTLEERITAMEELIMGVL